MNRVPGQLRFTADDERYTVALSAKPDGIIFDGLSRTERRQKFRVRDSDANQARCEVRRADGSTVGLRGDRQVHSKVVGTTYATVGEFDGRPAPKTGSGKTGGGKTGLDGLAATRGQRQGCPAASFSGTRERVEIERESGRAFGRSLLAMQDLLLDEFARILHRPGCGHVPVGLGRRIDAGSLPDVASVQCCQRCSPEVSRPPSGAYR